MKVDYLEDPHEFRITAPTAELHELVRGLPAAREQKKLRHWLVPASPATLRLIVRRFRAHGMDATDAFNEYRYACKHGAIESHNARMTAPADLPPIPLTRIQPEGKWLHQRRAFWHCFPLEASMLDVTMGGGKTKIAIDLLLNWEARDVLIISPLAAIEDAWEPHLRKHMMRPYSLATLNSGTLKQKTQRARDLREMPGTICGERKCRYPDCNCPVSYAPLDNPHRIAVINHESFWRDPFASWAASVRWDLVIVDEIHREKSAGSFSSKYLHRLASRARRRLGMTGTMMPHSPLDVYGQFRFLDRGIFGTNHAQFEEKHALFGGYMEREVVGFRNLPRIQKKVATIAIHIDDSEQGLPETVDIKHSVQLEPPARRMYQAMEKEFVAEVKEKGGHIVAANSGVKLLRLHQIACGIGVVSVEGSGITSTHRVSSAKIRGVLDVLADLKRSEPVVIFVRFRPDIDDLIEVIRDSDRTVSEMSGKVNQLQEWKAGHTDVLVAQIQAVKEGVDLTRSSFGIFHSTGISLGDYLQCRKRLHRPPQSRMVRFVHILATATKDVTTMWALQQRKQVIKVVLDDVMDRQRVPQD